MNQKEQLEIQKMYRAQIAGEQEAPVRKDTAQATDITQLRADYAEVVGKKPYHGWDAKTLSGKIKEAQGATD